MFLADRYLRRRYEAGLQEGEVRGIVKGEARGEAKESPILPPKTGLAAMPRLLT